MVTIDALKNAGRLLELGCFACHLHLYVNPALIGVPGDTPANFERPDRHSSARPFPA